MATEKSVYNFASTKSSKKRPPADHLDYDTRRAQELGYGVHYGRYKADHPNTRAEYERAAERKPKKPPTKTILTCKMCGLEFVKGTGPKQLYCSPECKEEAGRRAKQESKERKRAKYNTATTCPICGAEFVSSPKHIKYCSVECSNQANRENSARLRKLYRQEANEHGND